MRHGCPGRAHLFLWEKELVEQKDNIEAERQELVKLRKLVEDFEEQKEKAVKEANSLLQKDLTNNFEIEKKLRDQEIKSEKEILNLRINNLSSENTRLINEISILKKALEEATKQVKDIAVKVIESSSSSKTLQSSE